MMLRTCRVIKVTDGSCYISKQDSTAELFRQASLLVIDEVTMGHRHIYEAIDRTLHDIRENDSICRRLATDSPCHAPWLEGRHCGCMSQEVIHLATCTTTGNDY